MRQRIYLKNPKYRGTLICNQKQHDFNILTLSLLLSFSFMGISQSLPATGYIKMVDVWMIFTMSYPFFVIILHCLQEVRFDKFQKHQAWDDKCKGKERWTEKLVVLMIFPILPLLGLSFALIFFLVGLYVVNYPYLKNLLICDPSQ